MAINGGPLMARKSIMSFSFSPELCEQLKHIAADSALSRSEIVEQMLRPSFGMEPLAQSQSSNADSEVTNVD